VFLVYGWRKPERQIAELAKEVLRNKEDKIEWRDAERPSSGEIIDKICKGIEWADHVFCVFPRRFSASMKGSRRKIWLTSPYVLTEGAFALGRYYPTRDYRKVHILIEKGIEPQENFGILRELKTEYIEIDLKDLETSFNKINEYIEDVIEESQETGLPAYLQKSLIKDSYIYSNGNALFRNIVKIVVVNADEIETINHVLFSTKPLRSMDELQEAKVSYDGKNQFFRANLISINDEKVDEKVSKLEVVEVDRRGNDVCIVLKLPKIGYNNFDTIKYQYLWGVPGLYKPATSSKKKKHHVLLKTSYGKLDYVSFALHFSKDYKFSKTPYYQEAINDVSDNPRYGNEVELEYRDDVFSDTYYIFKMRGFYGSIITKWEA
jgi:hypothetical protein